MSGMKLKLNPIPYVIGRVRNVAPPRPRLVVDHERAEIRLTSETIFYPPFVAQCSTCGQATQFTAVGAPYDRRGRYLDEA